ncbi:MAG: hypothetical protein BAJATHORv1_20439 [Candidatus Thorarchaeota archaeon]|nr:MAG: hypothetical protein BAJATHORv1_20439 [Candidatus Thorarchaeota archaeon]
MNILGLRKEEKPFETRVPVVPAHVAKLVSEQKLDFLVEPSDQRAFGPDEYLVAHAKIEELHGSEASVILGVKEMPIDFFESDKVYIFFSHTIKGQDYNMSMLQKIIDTKSSLLDYECVVDDSGRRLIYFGNWAGFAGMSDTLRVLGERLDYEGIKPNPFKGIKTTLDCRTLDCLRDEFLLLGERIESMGLPETLRPLVVGFAGYGNVSKGAQELFDILPHIQIDPEDLPDLKSTGKNVLYKCVFREEHMVEPIDKTAEFKLSDYYQFGSEKYQGVFQNYIPYLTVLMNCIYWSEKYPRLITKDYIRNHWKDASRQLRVVGDISCDVEGAIEFTVMTTKPDKPAFTFLIEENRGKLGISGTGPVVMAVDNLPCELPRESSTSFSESLLRFLPTLAKTDFKTDSFETLDLCRELKNAIIVYRGELTPQYKYLEEYLNEAN